MGSLDIQRGCQEVYRGSQEVHRGFERNWSAWGRTYTNIRNRLGFVTADMMMYIKVNYAATGLTIE